MAEWVSFVRDLGIPAAALVAIGVATVRFANWLAPRCDRLVDGHCQLMSELQQQSKRQTECMERISEGQESIATTQVEILALIRNEKEPS